jgi:rRNA-processing protein FCF1
MINVILDSNFLFIPFRYQIDIFEELDNLLGRAQPFVLSTTLQEVRKLLRRRSDKIKTESISALEIAKHCKVLFVEQNCTESYDDIILRIAKKVNYAVATNDSNLRKRLRKAGVTTIYLRKKSQLKVEGQYIK